VNNQAKILMASFIYFAIVMDKNDLSDDIPKDLKKLFRKLGWVTQKYSHKYQEVNDEMNVILKDVNKSVDYMLMSVSIIAEYYEQTRGKRRYFTPMSWKEIVKLQDECLELSDKNAKDTFDVAEIIVREFLK